MNEDFNQSKPESRLIKSKKVTPIKQRMTQMNTNSFGMNYKRPSQSYDIQEQIAINEIEKPYTEKVSTTNLDFSAVELESNEFTLQELESLPNSCQKKYNDAIYIGQMINGKRQGKGVMRYKNG